MAKTKIETLIHEFACFSDELYTLRMALLSLKMQLIADRYK